MCVELLRLATSLIQVFCGVRPELWVVHLILGPVIKPPKKSVGMGGEHTVEYLIRLRKVRPGRWINSTGASVLEVFSFRRAAACTCALRMRDGRKKASFEKAGFGESILVGR